MSVQTLFRRLLGSVRTSAFERGMDAELRHHLDLETEALVARGMEPEAARAAARQRFGSVALVKDDCRESWGMRPTTTRRTPGGARAQLYLLAERARRRPVLTALVSLDFVKYATPVSPQAFYRSVLDKAAAEPGADLAALGITAPLDQAAPLLGGFIVEGQAPDEKAVRRVDFKFASPDYFKTIGMTLLSGRAFTTADDATAPPVAIVNLSMARHNFPDPDPIGRHISVDRGRTWMTIVGLVNDTHDYGLNETPIDEGVSRLCADQPAECHVADPHRG